MECVTGLPQRDGCTRREMYEQSGIFSDFTCKTAGKKKTNPETKHRGYEFFFPESAIFFNPVSFIYANFPSLKNVTEQQQACLICHCSSSWKNSQNSCLLFFSRYLVRSCREGSHLEPSDKYGTLVVTFVNINCNYLCLPADFVVVLQYISSQMKK